MVPRLRLSHAQEPHPLFDPTPPGAEAVRARTAGAPGPAAHAESAVDPGIPSVLLPRPATSPDGARAEQGVARAELGAASVQLAEPSVEQGEVAAPGVTTAEPSETSAAPGVATAEPSAASAALGVAWAEPGEVAEPVTRPLSGLVRVPDRVGRVERAGPPLVLVSLVSGAVAAVLGAWLLGLVVFVAASVGGCLLAQREAARHAKPRPARTGAQSKALTPSP